MANGIDLLLADHRRVEALFAAFADAPQAIVLGQLIGELVLHDAAEHAALYPFALATLGESDLVAGSLVAHSWLKQQIHELRPLEGASLREAVERLRVLVAEHVAEEEGTLFPALTEAASPADLDVLGARLVQAKQRVG